MPAITSKYYVSRESWLVDETLASADLRRAYGVNVLGIQRGDKRITSPRPEEIIHDGDVLYVVGEESAVAGLERVPARQTA